MANNLLGSGRTELKLMIDSVENGEDIAAIFAPPEPFEWTPDKAHRVDPPNPDVASLQERGLLMSLFTEDEQKNMLTMLSLAQPQSGIPYAAVPVEKIPRLLSHHILLEGVKR